MMSAPATTASLPPARLGPGPTLAWAVACGVLGALVFYRSVWLSGFDLVFGDDGDARLAMLLMEHWFRVLSGRAAFFSPIFFHPTPDVIGFTDANFLFGLVYSAGRAMGMTTYGAFQLVVVAWGAIGYAAMVWLLRRVLRCHLAVCLVWANLFAFSNLDAIQVGHMQLLVVAFVPLLIGLALLVLRGLAAESRLRWGPALAIAVLYPLMMFTGFYVCWYAALFAVTALAAAAALAAFGRRTALRAALAAAWRRKGALLVVAAVAVLCALPFAAAYGPQLLHSNGFPVDPLFLASFPHPRDLIDVGGENLVWGGLVLRLIPDVYSRLNGYELLMGMPPGFMLLFAAATVAALWSAYRGGPLLPAVLAAATWLGLLMIVNLHGHSAWWLVRAAVPGAKSIRVVSRYEVVLYATALVASAPVASAWATRGLASRRAGLAVAACAAFLLLEQTTPTFARVSKSADLARLLRVPPPPPECRFFALEPSGAGGDHDAAVRREQVDGIYQAMRFGLPTINGLSSLNPPGYWFYDIAAPFSRLEAGMWLARFGLLSGACTLNLATGQWAALSADPVPLPAGINLLDLPESQRGFASGMRFADEGLAGPMPTPWTGGDARWRFSVPRRAKSVTLRFAVVNKAGSDVVLSIDGAPVRQAHLAPGGVEWVQTLDHPVKEIGLRANTFRPSADGVSTDTRDLGVLMTWLSFDE